MGGIGLDFRIVPEFFDPFSAGTRCVFVSKCRPAVTVRFGAPGGNSDWSRKCGDGATYSGAWKFGPPDTDCRSVAWIVEAVSRYWENRFSGTSTGGSSCTKRISAARLQQGQAHPGLVVKTRFNNDLAMDQ